MKEVGTPIILYGRLYTKYETIITEVDTFADEKLGAVYSRGGEVIVPASGETAEDISIASVVEKSGVLLGGDLNIIIPPSALDSAFLAISISNGKPHNDMAKMAQGKSVVHLHNSDLEKIGLNYPCFEEQTRISGFFRGIDHLITLHQCKYGKKEKETIFAWEQRKLSEVLINLQNNTLSRAELSADEGVAKNVHYGDILVKFGEVLDVSDEQLPMIKDDTIVAKYKTSFLQNGDVIIADTAEDETVGKCTEIAGLDDEIVISGLHTIPYRPLFKFASGYLGYYMNSTAYHSQLLPLMQGIKVTSISKSAMQNTDIVYPKSVDEQKQIGDYFRNIDHLITLHQRKQKWQENLLKFIKIIITAIKEADNYARIGSDN